MEATRKSDSIMQGFMTDTAEVQKLQAQFAKVAKVVCYCVNEDKIPITVKSGDIKNIEIMNQKIPRETIDQVLDRILGDSLEEQTVEDLPIPNLKLGVISIRVNHRNLLNWIVCAVISNPKTEGYNMPCVEDVGVTVSEEEFYDSLDLLRESSRVIFRDQAVRYSAEAESYRSRSKAQEMDKNLRAVSAMADIIKLLDCDEGLEIIFQKFLKIVGTHLNISHAQVFQFYDEQEQMDIIAQWHGEAHVPMFDKKGQVQRIDFFHVDKAVSVSWDNLQAADKAGELEAYGIKAVMVFPLIAQNGYAMTIGFCQKMKERVWTIEEVKFVSHAVKILQSLLTRRIQKNSVTSSYQALEAIMDHVGSSIYVTDQKTQRVLFANRLCRNAFATKLREGTMDTFLKNRVPHGKSLNTYELFDEEDGLWYDLLLTEISWVDGKKAILYVLYDVTDKKVYQKKIEQQAYTDFLTGLYNRMCCERDLARCIEKAKRQKKKGALLYLDLDDFKRINDGLGHQFGDILLRSISESMRKINGLKESCYRVGGDEFIIIVSPDVYPEFERIIADIKNVFIKPWFLKDSEYYCTMSMGIVIFPEEEDNVQDLIRKADVAMYEAKKGGKNRLSYYAIEDDQRSGRRLDIEKNMRDAMVAGYKEFEVYYQPIIDIQREGTPCTGAEALIRWNSAELGFMSPNEFIPLAEYLGLINPIGNHILRNACVDCKYWNDHGHPEYKVNVNLSVVQLLQPDIVESVQKAIDDSGINPKNLTLEVTESLAINDMNRMKTILGNIKKLGVRIALDDFGTGYSSLNHIREIPFDVIKVDRSFILDLDEDAYSQSFIKMVSELASTIGVSICVEGIERKEQYKVLEGMKVRLVQGYYFDKPMRKSDFEEKYV